MAGARYGPDAVKDSMAKPRVAIRAETPGAEGLYRRLWEGAGCEVVSSSAGPQAPEPVAQVPDRVDAVVVDAGLVLDAPDAFARPIATVRSIFVFTGPDLAAAVRSVLADHPLQLVLRPFSPSEVQDLIGDVLSARRRSRPLTRPARSS
jgi:hypothetical protein